MQFWVCAWISSSNGQSFVKLGIVEIGMLQRVKQEA